MEHLQQFPFPGSPLQSSQTAQYYLPTHHHNDKRNDNSQALQMQQQQQCQPQANQHHQPSENNNNNNNRATDTSGYLDAWCIPFSELKKSIPIPPPKRRGPRGGVVAPFPCKLYEALAQVENEPETRDVVAWQSHGRCFFINQPTAFVEEILPRFFRHTKLTSFQRQLNLYGFTRLTSGRDRGGYYHELFLKGRPDLLPLMHRIRGPDAVASIRGSTRHHPHHESKAEPNLWQYPPAVGRDSGTGKATLPDTSYLPNQQHFVQQQEYHEVNQTGKSTTECKPPSIFQQQQQPSWSVLSASLQPLPEAACAQSQGCGTNNLQSLVSTSTNLLSSMSLSRNNPKEDNQRSCNLTTDAIMMQDQPNHPLHFQQKRQQQQLPMPCYIGSLSFSNNKQGAQQKQQQYSVTNSLKDCYPPVSPSLLASTTDVSRLQEEEEEKDLDIDSIFTSAKNLMTSTLRRDSNKNQGIMSSYSSFDGSDYDDVKPKQCGPAKAAAAANQQEDEANSSGDEGSMSTISSINTGKYFNGIKTTKNQRRSVSNADDTLCQLIKRIRNSGSETGRGQKVCTSNNNNNHLIDNMSDWATFVASNCDTTDIQKSEALRRNNNEEGGPCSPYEMSSSDNMNDFTSLFDCFSSEMMRSDENDTSVDLFGGLGFQTMESDDLHVYENMMDLNLSVPRSAFGSGE